MGRRVVDCKQGGTSTETGHGPQAERRVYFGGLSTEALRHGVRGREEKEGRKRGRGGEGSSGKSLAKASGMSMRASELDIFAQRGSRCRCASHRLWAARPQPGV
eukprot:scaffold16496_cov120-Isochrysis_galbana.AAC.3